MKIYANKNNMNYQVEYEKYKRYYTDDEIDVSVSRFTAYSDIEALDKVAEKHMYGSILKDHPYITYEEMLDYINNTNGDGCDYIFTITNLTTGELLYKAEFSPEDQPWDE